MTNLSEKQGGGLIYNPPMMLFDGSTGYYSKTYTSSGNKISMLGRFTCNEFSGVTAVLARAQSVTPAKYRMSVAVGPSDDATVAFRNKLRFACANASAVNLVRLISNVTVVDGATYTFGASFDGDLGLVSFVINMVNADDTGNASRIAPVAGSLDSGASSTLHVGAQNVSGSATTFWSDAIGFFAMKDAYISDWSLYFDQFGNPKPTDFSGWLFGHFAGKMDENEGTAGAMTKNGTITLADPGVCPHIGLPTIGTAEAWDLKTGKIAWVDGVEKIGTGYFPALMQFNGTTGYYSKTGITTAGSVVTACAEINLASFSGGGNSFIMELFGPTYNRLSLLVRSNDHANTTERNRLVVSSHNNAGSQILRLFSPASVADGELHTIFMGWNATTGAYTLVIDGSSGADTGQANHLATTGTLDSGAASRCAFGGTAGGGSLLAGLIGFAGNREAYLTTWSDFMQADGTPKQLDESTWTEWGAQPLFWHESGLMTENKGSAGAMTANGTIILAAASTWS